MKRSSAVVLEYLRRKPEGITSRDAWLDVGCARLAARISDLKAEGYQIDSEIVPVFADGRTAHVARYTLQENVQLRIALA